VPSHEQKLHISHCRQQSFLSSAAYVAVLALHITVRKAASWLRTLTGRKAILLSLLSPTLAFWEALVQTSKRHVDFRRQLTLRSRRYGLARTAAQEELCCPSACGC